MPKLSECKILITGTQGQVGYELIKALANTGAQLFLSARDQVPLNAYGLKSIHLDLENLSEIRARLNEIKPDIVINPAAYTAVDKAEVDSARAYMVNQKAVHTIAETMQKLGGSLIHFSTDYVYNSQHKNPNREDDLTSPCNVYGSSKLAGEQALLEIAIPALILRTSWVYGSKGNNFVKTMLRLGRERDQLSIVADQIGSPTSTSTLAQTVQSILIQGFDDPVEFIRRKSGIYNICDEGFTSWSEFAKEIFSITRSLGHELKIEQVSEINTSEYKTTAQRPLNSRMSLDKIKRELNIFPATWQRNLYLFLYESHIKTI